MKIVIQTKETGVRRLFGIQSDVEVIKSLDLVMKEKAKEHESTTNDIAHASK